MKTLKDKFQEKIKNSGIGDGSPLRLAFIFSLKDNNRSGTESGQVIARLVRLINGDRNHIRNFGTCNAAEGLTDLRADTYIYPQYEHAWGQYKIQYTDVFSLDLERAKVCVEVLEFIDKGLTRITAKWGPASTFGDWLCRLIEVTGAESLITCAEGAGNGDYDSDHHLYRFWKQSDCASVVNQEINRWLEEARLKRGISFPKVA